MTDRKTALYPGEDYGIIRYKEENASREKIKKAQKAMNDLGYRDAEGNPLAEDGIRGPKTIEAEKSFLGDKKVVRLLQNTFNALGYADPDGNALKVDGIAGEKTRFAFDSFLGGLDKDKDLPSAVSALWKAAASAPERGENEGLDVTGVAVPDEYQNPHWYDPGPPEAVHAASLYAAKGRENHGVASSASENASREKIKKAQKAINALGYRDAALEEDLDQPLTAADNGGVGQDAPWGKMGRGITDYLTGKTLIQPPEGNLIDTARGYLENDPNVTSESLRAAWYAGWFGAAREVAYSLANTVLNPFGTGYRLGEALSVAIGEAMKYYSANDLTQIVEDAKGIIPFFKGNWDKSNWNKRMLLLGEAYGHTTSAIILSKAATEFSGESNAVPKDAGRYVDDTAKGAGKGAKHFDDVQLKTEPNKAYFWSGMGETGAGSAASIAKKNGGVTLETTIEAQGIQLPKWDFNNPSAVKAWQDASATYAKQVSGEVRAVIGPSVKPDSIWNMVELPALKANPNVTKIITVDPVTQAETIMLTR